MNQYKKVYIAIKILVDTDGNYKPIALIWENGKTYNIDKVLSKKMSPPKNVGAILTIKFDVLIEGKRKTLYQETTTNRWFVEQLI